MNTKQGLNPNRGSENALERAMNIALEREERRRRSMVAAWVAGTAIVLTGTIGLLAGCGGGGTTASSTTPESSAETRQAVVASAGSITPVAESTPLARPVEVSNDLNALPPDMVAAVSDTFVTPGEPVEVRVEGTPDISEMALSDGRGEPLPMVRDTVGNTWRVGYRVPLRPKQDRIGLSVTAKNDQHRWSRVWVFLQVDDGKQSVESQAAKPDTNQ